PAVARRDRAIGPPDRGDHPQRRDPGGAVARHRLGHASEAALSPLLVGGASVSPRCRRTALDRAAQSGVGTAVTPSVLSYVQHLLGIGHLQRSLRIANALVREGAAVTLVSGGEPV